MNVLKVIEVSPTIFVKILKNKDGDFVISAFALKDDCEVIIGRMEIFPSKYFTYQFVEYYIPTFIKSGVKKKDFKDYCMNLITVME